MQNIKKKKKERKKEKKKFIGAFFIKYCGGIIAAVNVTPETLGESYVYNMKVIWLFSSH